MSRPYTSPTMPTISTLDVRVSGPDCDPVSDADLRRLFPGSTLTQERLDRVRTWPRVIIACDGRPVGLATYQKTELELRVPEVGLDTTCGCGERDVLTALLDALEVAGLAGGCRRLIVSPPRTSLGYLERRGFTPVRECCAGGWIEKTLE